MNKLFFKVIAACIATSFTYCAFALSKLQIHSLQTQINAYRKQYHIPGLSVSILMPHSKKVMTLSSGIRNLKTQEEITPKTLFQICSITKVYTAILIHQLVSEHKLSLSQTIGDWLPQYKNWKDVTIQQLLNMHSGITSFTNLKGFNGAWQKAPLKQWTPQEELKYVSQLPLKYKPGTNWNYSDTNYILLGLIIEKATGKTYQQELNSRIIKPLNLTKTYYLNRLYTPEELKKMVTAYSQTNKDVTHINMSQAGAAGAIVATTADTARFFNAVFQGKLLTHKELKKMLVPYSIHSGKTMSTNKNVDEAWALGVDQLWMRGVGKVWNKTGGFVGAFAQACYSVKGHITVVMAANKMVPKALYESTRTFIPKLYQIITQN